MQSRRSLPTSTANSTRLTTPATEVGRTHPARIGQNTKTCYRWRCSLTCGHHASQRRQRISYFCVDLLSLRAPSAGVHVHPAHRLGEKEEPHIRFTAREARDLESCTYSRLYARLLRGHNLSSSFPSATLATATVYTYGGNAYKTGSPAQDSAYLINAFSDTAAVHD